MTSQAAGDAKASVPSPSGWSRTSKSLPRAEERRGCKERSSEYSPILVILRAIYHLADIWKLGQCKFIIGKRQPREHSSFVLQGGDLGNGGEEFFGSG
jgi:hypothetical protein